MQPAIECFLTQPRELLEDEREFSGVDLVLVRMAEFDTLHAARLRASDLHTQTLSLLTSLIVAETKS
ncbi:hypothetical protein [Paraburkholderia sp. GAS32]|uniref:hypothetical protein n=1 Tax=Paraburkholderia sp. GAS32 TaxID=3035129 RepID=UPI003D1EF926